MSVGYAPNEGAGGAELTRRDRRIVNHISYAEPEAAAPWATRVNDRAQRHNLITQVAQQWMRIDPEAARAWLARTDLPWEQQPQLLAPSNPQLLPEVGAIRR